MTLSIQKHLKKSQTQTDLAEIYNPFSFSMVGSEESCCSDLGLVRLIITIRKFTAL